MKNKELTTRKHYIVKNYLGNQGLRYNMNVYNVFGHCSQEKVKRFAEKDLRFVNTSAEELLAFVKGRLEDMFSESSDKAVMDNPMLTYLQDGNQKGNEQEDKEVLEDAEEEDAEEKEDNVNGAKVIITDHFIKFNIVRADDFYILNKDTNWLTRSHMVMCSHILRDVILDSETMLKEKVQLKIEDAVRENIPLADELLRLYLRDNRLHEKIKIMKKNIKKKGEISFNIFAADGMKICLGK